MPSPYLAFPLSPNCSLYDDFNFIRDTEKEIRLLPKQLAVVKNATAEI